VLTFVKFYEVSSQAELVPFYWMLWGETVMSAACLVFSWSIKHCQGAVLHILCNPRVLHLPCDKPGSLVIGNEKLLMYHSLATKMFAYQILKKVPTSISGAEVHKIDLGRNGCS